MAFDKPIDRKVTVKRAKNLDGLMNHPILFCDVQLRVVEGFKGRNGGVQLIGLTKGEAEILYKLLGEQLNENM
jgi:hypothetical protein